MKAFILYYLSIKATHGYEIQRFIEVNELNQWTKIQSGSIYYALSKLERDGLIESSGNKKTADKSKKVYHITPAGRDALEGLLRETIASPLWDAGSDKFFMFPMFSILGKAQMEEEIGKQIKALEKKKGYLLSWKKVKINESSLQAQRLAFDIMIKNLEMQIEWHEAVLSDYEAVAKKRRMFDGLVSIFHFDTAQNVHPEDTGSYEELVKKVYGI